MIHIARAVCLEATVASYGLLEDLLFRFRGSQWLGLYGPPETFLFISAVGRDSMVSDSRYSLQTVTNLISASVSECDTGFRLMQVNDPGTSHSVKVADIHDLRRCCASSIGSAEKADEGKMEKRVSICANYLVRQ